MEKQTKDKKAAAAAYDERLPGTFAGVFMIGAFIAASWLVVFYFYIITV